MPKDTNPHGSAFGGKIISWIDETAAIAAARHCEKNVVTVGMDSVAFITPIYPGEHVLIKAYVTYTGRTSMEVAVELYREKTVGVKQIAANIAHLTFVAVNKKGKPVKVPKLEIISKDDKLINDQAALRVKTRKELRVKLDEIENNSH
jgi:acyl-CoA hydrolase